MRRGVLLFAFAALAPSAGGAQTVDEAISELRAGAYETAIEALGEISRSDPGPDLSLDDRRRAYVAYLSALAEVGRYEDALEALTQAPPVIATELANTAGEIYYGLGQIDRARDQFNRAVQGGAVDRHSARLNLAIIEWTYGDRDAAFSAFDSFIDLYNGSTPLSSTDLTAVATAVRYLGIREHELFQDALRAYDEAVAADPGNLEPLILIGELFLDKYNGPEADATIKEVLQKNPNHPRALLGLARAMEFNGTVGSMDQVDSALEQNENLVEARIFKARLLLKAENHEEARSELRRALEVNPTSLEALSVLAASHYLRGETGEYDRIRDQVTALSPTYAELYNDIADLSVDGRKYLEATRVAEEAIRVDSLSWRAYGILGMNQLRLGLIEEARANLETAFEGDPHSVWFYNTLELLDTFEYYDVDDEDPRFLFVLHGRESALLQPYIEQIAEEAFDALVDRYGGYEPPLPIRIEVYPNHGDFSVRTIGLAGMGALGVTFGSLLAMDSPAARPVGDFNWASVLWHELAHVFHLGLTEHEVPRWFSEGLAVHEQRRAREGWGHQPAPGFLNRYREGMLLPVSELNSGFVQPSYPEQVIDSYLQASLVFDFIETRWGLQAIRDMLHGYRDGRATPELMENLLDISMDELDRDFDAYFQQRFGGPLKALEPPVSSPGIPSSPQTIEDWTRVVRENPGNFPARLSLGIMLFQEGRLEEAEEHLSAAVGLFPEYGGMDSPYWFLAQVHQQREETEQAADALARLTALNESHYAAFLQLAELRTELGDAEGAAEAMDAAVLIYPYEVELHDRLAQAHEARGDAIGAVRERRAIVALAPADLAGAYFDLALAYVAAGDPAQARRAVLRALEIAPNFRGGLELLLDLRSGAASDPPGGRVSPAGAPSR
jgi:tetratricopeptide (TPR) repeat protein